VKILHQTLAAIALSVSLLVSASHASVAYKRDYFHHWIDADRDGLNTREEMLVAQIVYDGRVPYTSLSYNEDKITAGTWVCPYTGMVIHDPRKLDIDHIVPLAWAWDHGADTWTYEQREAFANDPENLLVVTARANRSKGAKGPDEWLPSRDDFRDEYIRLFQYICQKYNLTTTTQ